MSVAERLAIDSRQWSSFYFIFSIFWGSGPGREGVINLGYLVIAVLMQKTLFHHLGLPVN
jgi:hypothetical protein